MNSKLLICRFNTPWREANKLHLLTIYILYINHYICYKSILTSPTAVCQAIWEVHQGTQSRWESLYNWLLAVMVTSGKKSLINGIAETCTICTMNNPKTSLPKGPQIRPIETRELYPDQNLKIGFPACRDYWEISGSPWS